jgi:hypothetical protein
MKRSFFYADGDEDAASCIGSATAADNLLRPRSDRPQEGWPITRFGSRGSVGPIGTMRNLVGMSLVRPPAGSLGLSGRRGGFDFSVERWLDALFTSTGVTIDVQGENTRGSTPRRCSSSTIATTWTY